MKYEFKLDKEQTERFEKWAEKQAKKTARSSDSFGFRFQFIFGPTGMGCNVRVVDAFTKEYVDLTQDDDGEFLFNEDGTKNGWT
jgi:hypothetical protein